MDSKQLVSARLTLSYHNLIILMILLLNLRHCTCIHPGGGEKTMVECLVWISHEAREMSKGEYTVCVFTRVCVCVCINTHMQMWLCVSVSLSTDKHNPAAPTTATPPDTENKKVMENYSHKTTQRIISQTPQPEGAWLWRFIIAYWIIWINLTRLGLCVFPSSQLSRLFVSDNYTKWVISFRVPFLFPLAT